MTDSIMNIAPGLGTGWSFGRLADLRDRCARGFGTAWRSDRLPRFVSVLEANPHPQAQLNDHVNGRDAVLESIGQAAVAYRSPDAPALPLRFVFDQVRAVANGAQPTRVMPAIDALVASPELVAAYRPAGLADEVARAWSVQVAESVREDQLLNDPMRSIALRAARDMGREAFRQKFGAMSLATPAAVNEALFALGISDASTRGEYNRLVTIAQHAGNKVRPVLIDFAIDRQLELGDRFLHSAEYADAVIFRLLGVPMTTMQFESLDDERRALVQRDPSWNPDRLTKFKMTSSASFAVLDLEQAWLRA